MEQRKSITIRISGPAQTGKSTLAAWLAETLRINGHSVTHKDDVGNLQSLPPGVDPLSPEGQEHRRGQEVPYLVFSALAEDYEQGLNTKAWSPTDLHIEVSEASS